MALSQSAASELLDAFRAGDSVDLIRPRTGTTELQPRDSRAPQLGCKLATWRNAEVPMSRDVLSRYGGRPFVCGPGRNDRAPRPIGPGTLVPSGFFSGATGDRLSRR